MLPSLSNGIRTLLAGSGDLIFLIMIIAVGIPLLIVLFWVSAMALA